MGPPYFGESLALLRNPFGFLEERHRRHGPVFKSRVLGRNVVFLTGLEGAEAFYDDDLISREHAHPQPLADLFGGDNMEMFDGDRHLALKTITLAAVDGDALAHYLPDLQRLFETRLAEWSAAPGGEVSATVELRRLAIEAICLNILGLEPGPATDGICRDYGRLLNGLVSPPAKVPGTPYARGRRARDRLLTAIRAVIAERRAAPGLDGLSRLLAARAPDGRGCTDDEAALEVHHIVLAGFIVCGLLAEVVRRLPELPDVARRCRAEVAEHAAIGPLTVDGLAHMATATTVVMEAKRFVPLVPLAFGRARNEFTCAGCRVPEGWRVYLSLRVSNLDPALFADPERFDPDRFGPDRAEHLSHPLAFIPQGTGPPTSHLCLGRDYSTVVVLAFLTVLVRGYEWDIPDQDLTLRFDTLPPAHRDGLRTRLRPRGTVQLG